MSNGITYNILTGPYVSVGYDFYSGAITIPSTVTDDSSGLQYTVYSIDDYAFNNSTITSIDLPSTLVAIGNGSFANCKGLKSLALPNSVDRITDQAFSGCKNLTSVHIGSMVTSIGSYAFSGCSALVSFTCDVYTPLFISATTFNGVNQGGCSLIVPTGRVSNYQETPVWMNFNPISDGSTLNTNESSIKNNTILYPNPAQSEINLVLSENENLTIYSIDGKLIKTTKGKIGTNTINVNDLPKGNYILKTKTASQKFIKK